MEGRLHIYHPKRNLLLFEHTPHPRNPLPSSAYLKSIPAPPNTLLFVGGMYDNFLSPRYTADLAAAFPRHLKQQWGVMHVQLSSAGRAFGTSDLNKDIDEIACAIRYIRETLRPSTPGNIVLLGHSTGCQGVIHYLSAPNPISPTKRRRPSVQGAILQAPASDRDQALYLVAKDPSIKSQFESALDVAHSTEKDLHYQTILPLGLTQTMFGPAPLSVSRFLSLASPSSPEKPGLDDFFSQDATSSRLISTFGAVGSNGLLVPTGRRQSHTVSDPFPSLLVIMSANDEFVPPTISKLDLLHRWAASMTDSGAKLHADSGVVENGNHGFSCGDDDNTGNKARLVDFRGRVLRYLDDMVGGVDHVAHTLIKEDEAYLEREERSKTNVGRKASTSKL